MSRPLRIDFENAWHHVMCRGRRRQDIFPDELAYERFLEILKETAELRHLLVASYCLMPNHYHLLVQTPRANLSRCMASVNSRYVQEINRRKKWDGALFKGRFKAILVQGDSYLLHVLRYIHRNPKRANLVSNIGDYPWSSHSAYAAGDREKAWLSTDFPLSLFNVSKAKRSAAYRSFVEGEDLEDVLSFYSRERIRSVFGDPSFIEDVRVGFAHEGKPREVSSGGDLDPSMEMILSVVAKAYGVEESSITRFIRGQSNEPRDVTVFLCWTLTGENMAGIARFIGLSHPRSVWSVVNKMRRKLDTNSNLYGRVGKIRRSLKVV